MDLLSTSGLLRLADVSLHTVLNGNTYHLYGAMMLSNGSHYIAIFFYNNRWVLYGGLREYQKQKSGLKFSI